MLDAGKRVREISPDLIKGFVAILAVAILSLPLTAVDHKWHADATRLAMKSHGFSDDARLLAQFTNFLIDLHSGVYPDGSEPGAPDHKNLNKDNSQRPFHKEAVEVMKRGSLEWLERLLKINEVPWDSLRSYGVKSIPTKRWLRKTDSALITGISSVVKHWDGPEPESRVFDTDPTKDRVKATGILLFVIEDYGLSFAMKDNPYRLPTPNYAGYYVYHIEHELARDLLPLRTFKKTPTIPAFKKD
jgi:hypothetical protein